MRDIIELIAVHNIPYTQLSSPQWKRFFHDMNPNFVVPSSDSFNKLIKSYAVNLENKSYSDLRGSSVGLCIDGAGFNIKKYYAVVLLNGKKARLAKVYHVEDQTANSLSDIVADVYRKASLNRIMITGTCSDNASNLVAALKGKGAESLSAKIGCYLLRVSCSAHTSQLSIIDIRRTDSNIDTILSNCISLSMYIDRRDKTFRQCLDVQRPSFIATRWNSACSVLEFMVNNHEQIDRFINDCIEAEDAAYQRRIANNAKRVANGEEPKPICDPSYPPVPAIPIEWSHLFEALKIIRTFTTRIEGDISLQQEVFIEARNVNFALTALEITGNPFAATLLNAFESRFMTTTDILIAELAWRSTPDGVIEWRNTFETERRGDNLNAKQNANEHYDALATRFIELCEEVFEITTDKQRAEFGFPALFHWWLESAPVDPGESTESLWKRMKERSVVIPGYRSSAPVSLLNLWKIAVALTTLPASESICERCFSQIKHLASDLNSSMKPELFEALATVKMASYYMNKYQ